MKAVKVAVAAAITLAPLSAIVSSGVAQASPCAGAGSNPVSCQHCLFYVQAYHTANVCYAPAPRPAPAPSSTVPIQIPEPPPVPPPSSTRPAPTPVQTPKINPSRPGTPRNISVVTPPKKLEAPAQAIAAAKAAPEARLNPADPPRPPTPTDFNQQVQNVINAHSDNIELIKADNKALVRPRHWEFVDYDQYHRPTLYNPLGQAMTFRYSYAGASREAYLPAGGRIVLDAGTVGLVPFTAVSESYLAAGSFYGGAFVPPDNWQGPPPPGYAAPAPPTLYQNVSAEIPAVVQTVQIGQVAVVGHDDSQPPGSQDTFLLDDSTLAWGQVNDPSSSTQIKVAKSQSLPGFGPTDNGSFLFALAAPGEPNQAAPPAPSQPWWPSALGFGLLGIAVVAVSSLLNRRKDNADDTSDSVTDSRHSKN
ncbi:hypothetical protein [Mycobacterium sherrisii]|uniref:Uncharacterized protein n=1 Tax=Mycobacterium sherrisii TaxID=243061 RepID=A0A1E3T5K5_9MYCO|nr:hypothetical protein [Mycobacterium sherrisii]MCV7029655.1 hypothetical protein [Mycobacterium sherrisii]MEC4762278.1 hypothetical protein [Mycobacterium sherrisii]ODR09650.1 hypothetical protein BHQ21_03365 [Mycobacterium sherrisii]ORW74946.1 hypothetical protein AWC25_14755 [Mycobacterium sherrisii]